MVVHERLSFEDARAGTLIAVEHRHRYRLAASLLEGARVLDLCCGTGYGARILAETARCVHGVDVDAPTVDAADAALSDLTQVTFEAADALEFLRRGDVAERFDAIVCFEGLEHLPDVPRVLDRLRELAAGGTRMLLSVPNSAGLEEDNEFHLTDFSWERALEAFAGFPDTTILTQHLAEGSLICSAETPEREPEARIVLDEGREPEYANHYIACVRVPAERLEALMQAEASPLANRYMKSLERANEELRRTNGRLTREHLGRAEAAAASELARREDRARLEAEFTALGEEHSAWVRRCLDAEARERTLLDALAAEVGRRKELESLSVLAVLKLRRRVKRGLRRGSA